MHTAVDTSFITGIGSVNERMLILMDIEGSWQRRDGLLSLRGAGSARPCRYLRRRDHPDLTRSTLSMNLDLLMRPLQRSVPRMLGDRRGELALLPSAASACRAL
jgi:hypothetical protein